MAVITNFHLRAVITLHNVLHELWVGRGMGTSSLEAKLLQQLMDMIKEVLYMVLTDIHKEN